MCGIRKPLVTLVLGLVMSLPAAARANPPGVLLLLNSPSAYPTVPNYGYSPYSQGSMGYYGPPVYYQFYYTYPQTYNPYYRSLNWGNSGLLFSQPRMTPPSTTPPTTSPPATSPGYKETSPGYKEPEKEPEPMKQPAPVKLP